MKKFRTSISVTIMIFAAIGGYLAGASANEAMGGAILFAMIAGIGCLVYAIDNQKESKIGEWLGVRKTVLR